MANWPATLPEPIISKFSYKAPEGNIARTEMESGPARQRRRFTSAPKRAEVTWLFTAEQLGTFEAFFEGDMDHGAAWFTMNVPIGGTNQSKNVRLVNGEYTAKTAAKEFLWEVVATVEIAV